MVVFTAVTALFTAVLAVFTVLLALYTRRLAKVAEDTAERQLRAYVQVEIEKVAFGTNSTTEVVLRASNVGQTPAYDVTVHSWVDVRPFPLPAGYSFLGPRADGPDSRDVINAGGAIRNKTGTARPLSPEMRGEIEQGTNTRLYVFGHVTYADTFKKPRHTNFCFAVKGAPNQLLDTAIYHEHNDVS